MRIPILNLEIKKAGPDLVSQEMSQDVQDQAAEPADGPEDMLAEWITHIEGLVDDISHGLQDLTRQYDELRRGHEAMRKKVYRDQAAENQVQDQETAASSMASTREQPATIKLENLPTGTPVSGL